MITISIRPSEDYEDQLCGSIHGIKHDDEFQVFYGETEDEIVIAAKAALMGAGYLVDAVEIAMH